MSQTKSREASSTLAPVAVAAGIVMGPYLTTRQPHQTTEDAVAEPAKISRGPKDQRKASDSHGRDGDGDDTGAR